MCELKLTRWLKLHIPICIEYPFPCSFLCYNREAATLMTHTEMSAANVHASGSSSACVDLNAASRVPLLGNVPIGFYCVDVILSTAGAFMTVHGE